MVAGLHWRTLVFSGPTSSEWVMWSASLQQLLFLVPNYGGWSTPELFHQALKPFLCSIGISERPIFGSLCLQFMNQAVSLCAHSLTCPHLKIPVSKSLIESWEEAETFLFLQPFDYGWSASELCGCGQNLPWLGFELPLLNPLATATSGRDLYNRECRI